MTFSFKPLHSFCWHFVFEIYVLMQTVSVLFTVCRACMGSVTRCIWVCPACWTAEACPAWSTWLWQKTRWLNCRAVPARCGTSRRTCRTSNRTAGGAVAWLLITSCIITLQSLKTDSSTFHTSTALPSVDSQACGSLIPSDLAVGVSLYTSARWRPNVTSTEWNAALTHLSSAVSQCGTTRVASMCNKAEFVVAWTGSACVQLFGGKEKIWTLK